MFSNQQQVANQAQEMKNRLDLVKQWSVLESRLAGLQNKLQRNQDEAMCVRARAEAARRQAGGLEEVISPTPPPKADKQCFFEG